MRHFEKIILLGGDLFLFYVSILCMLFVRGGASMLQEYGNEYFISFSILLPLWVFTLYVFDFYHPRHLKSYTHLLISFAQVVLINVSAGIVFFYLVQPFGISPKTNLVIFTSFFSLAMTIWRIIALKWMRKYRPKTNVYFLQLNDDEKKLIEEIESPLHRSVPDLETAEVIVFGSSNNMDDSRIFLAQHVLTGREVLDVIAYRELISMQVPIDIIGDQWELFRLPYRRELHTMKRVFDMMCSIALMVILFPIAILAALAVWLSSDGPIIYRQIRVGLHQKTFTLYKLRTMFIDAEKEGIQWSQKNDPRVTFVGKLLRHSHLDELPQLWNILKGDMSFVGPRPERPKIVDELTRDIPLYPLRHVVKPGITGWAQVNFRYGSSINDSKKKLSYDLYYVKHQTAFLDAKIIFQTIAHVFIGENHSS